MSQDWYVCFTKPRQEELAHQRLASQGYAVYLPRFVRWVRHARQWQRVSSALFPRYLFVQPGDAGQSLAPVRNTPGVAGLVRFGPELARLSALRMEALRRVVAALDAATPEQPFAAGAAVVFSHGPLTGLQGIVSQVADERVMVMFNLLGQPQTVAVPADQLACA